MMSQLFCIVPPDLLKRIALEGNDADRASAIETLSLDHSVRLARSETAGRRTIGERALGSLMSSAGKPNRIIYDQQHMTDTVGPVARAEGQLKSKDVTVNEAYDGLGATYKLYWENYHRDSIDAAGMPMHGHVHYGTKYNNAFWDGQEMLFGDGDGVLFTSFTASLDVIGHELTHGVTQHEANLVYSGQSGALNESISDCFGSLVKQYALGQSADQADWLIGAECVGKTLEPALRSMKDPGHANQYDNQPADMDHYIKTAEDNGGVHANSGIPNRAFYLAASGIGGNSWETAGRVWYESLRDPRIRPNTGFRSFARATVRQAGSIFGSTSAESDSIKNAWNEVKVL
jgi:Zn-dependent metalloprotease